jgi:hypothetical protein
MNKLLIGFFAFFSCGAYSATEEFSVQHVGVDLNSKVLFVGVSPASTSSTCNSRHEFKWNLADEGVKEIYSVVLMAQAANKKIKIGVSDGAVCVKTQPTGWWVRVES